MRAAAPARASRVLPSALGATAFGVFAVWAVRDGGFAPEQWLPGGLLVLAVLATCLAAPAARARLRAAPAAPGFLAAYTAWSYASILWARSPGDALDGANRTLVYCCVFTLFWVLPLAAGARLPLLGGWTAFVLASGLAALAQAGGARTTEGHFVLGRLAGPVAYPDADAALFLTAFLPLLVLSSRRELPGWARMAAAAGGAALCDLAALCQSRGSLVALALALIAALVLGRNLARTLAQIVVLAAAVAVALPALLDVYTTVVDGRDWAAATTRAGAWIAISAAVAAAGTAGAVAAERRVRIPRETIRALRRPLLPLAAAALASGAAAALLVLHPVARTERAWHDFTTNRNASPTERAHFASGVGTSRYDVWRIALGQFERHPVTGIGADNYLADYLRRRRTSEVARYPESVELRTLSETGIVGALLFLGFLAAALRRALHGARRGPDAFAGLAFLAGFGYWLIHASVDWFWEFPALAAPALALLALAASPAAAPERAPRRAAAGRVALGAGAAAALAGAAVLGLAWISVRQVDAAIAAGDGSHARALLRSAARLNPLGEQPPLVEATLAANRGDRRAEQLALREALRRNPDDWYPVFMLGIVAGREHRPAAARALLDRAHRMSPRDQVVIFAQRRLSWRMPLTEREVGSILREVTSTLRGARQR